MENVIVEKCIKIFESVNSIQHFLVAENFKNLAIKKIESNSGEYTKISNAWYTLYERFYG